MDKVVTAQEVFDNLRAKVGGTWITPSSISELGDDYRIMFDPSIGSARISKNGSDVITWITYPYASLDEIIWGEIPGLFYREYNNKKYLVNEYGQLCVDTATEEYIYIAVATNDAWTVVANDPDTDGLIAEFGGSQEVSMHAVGPNIYVVTYEDSEITLNNGTPNPAPEEWSGAEPPEPVVEPTIMWRKYHDNRGDFYYLVNEEGHILTDGINCYRATNMDGDTPTTWVPVNIGSDIVAIQRDWGDSVLVLYRDVYYNAFLITYGSDVYQFVNNQPSFELNQYQS